MSTEKEENGLTNNEMYCYGCDKLWEKDEKKYRIVTPVIFEVHLYCKCCYDEILDTPEQKENNYQAIASVESGLYK